MKPKAAILVVDDDIRLRSLLSEYLADQGFFVCVAAHAGEAREKLAWMQFDAMVLDRMMPGETGLELAADLRTHATPILMLTAMGETSDRIEGLEAGVQDYLSKPFEPRELVLRLDNLIARRESEKQHHFGEFVYYPVTQQLQKGEQQIYLTSSEQQILSLLCDSLGQTVSREVLAQALKLEESQARAVDVQMNRLRKKIEQEPSRPKHLQTVRGEGYRLS